MSKASSDKSGCLGVVLHLFGIKTSTGRPKSFPQLPFGLDDESLPFRLRDDFLSAAEISFYHILLSTVGDRLTVCPKVNLNDIFFVSHPDRNQASLNRISRKHIDFLLCDSRSMRPRVGIELDDSSHAREDRRARDAFVEQAFEAAGVALLRFPAQRAYNIAEVTSHLSPFLAEGAPTPALPFSHDTISAPLCPKCGIPLVIRSSSRGKFYGCANYPKCRQTMRL
jgi:very-short-patch-repair endonuclease